MTELPIVVSDDVVTVGGYTNQVELQLSVGATGERGSRIFTGSVDPTTLPTDSPIWGGYTDFKSGDIYLLRDTGVLEVWEWLYASGEYTWVRTVNDIGDGGDSVTLDPDLDAIANLTGTGLARRTAPNTWTLDTAAYLTSNQTITLSGDVSGGGTTSIVTTVADDSHSHTEATISALAAKAPLASPTFTGTVTGLVSSSTDNAVARFDGTGGALQNSSVTIDDSGFITGGRLHINSAGGGESTVFLQSGGTNRWKIYKDTSVEGGGNGGSHLVIEKRTDAGGGNGAVVTLLRDTGRVRLHSVGSTAGLEFGSSGPRMMMGTGGPSGISAPVGSTWRQTNANTSHGSLTGLLWNKVGTGTTEGTDWLVDYEGRWVTYTATWTNVSMSSTTARYTRRGKFVTFSCVGTLSSAPSGAVSVTTPTDMGSDMAHGPVRLVRSGSWQGVWFYTSASSVLVRYLDDANTWQNLSSTLPSNWASGDKIALNGTYEIA